MLFFPSPLRPTSALAFICRPRLLFFSKSVLEGGFFSASLFFLSLHPSDCGLGVILVGLFFICFVTNIFWEGESFGGGGFFGFFG